MKRYLLMAAFAVIVACVIVAVGSDVAFAASSIGDAFNHVDHPTFTKLLAESAAGLAALEKQMGELAGELKTAADNVKKSAETTQAEIKNLGKTTDETKGKANEALSKYGELATKHTELVTKHGEAVARLVEVEQKLASNRNSPQVEEEKSIGATFVESKEFKDLMAKGGKGKVRVPMSRKTITSLPSTVGSNTSGSTSLVPALRVPGIVTPPEQKMTLRNLLAPGQTASSMVEYVQETGFTNNAAVVTEGATKPTSDLTFELKNAPVRTIAHLFKASRQILDDAPALQSYINARASYGLRLTEEDEFLNGDGTGAHIKGLIPYATAFNAAFVPTSQNKMDTIRLAILQVFLSNFPANGIVLHPTDWASIQLTKDGNARYIIGNPQDGSSARLWNLPVAESLSMDANGFLVGAFDLGAQIFDRLDIEVLLSTENNDDFEKNMVTIRAEERAALAVYRPEAFVHGDFTTAT